MDLLVSAKGSQALISIGKETFYLEANSASTRPYHHHLAVWTNAEATGSTDSRLLGRLQEEHRECLHPVPGHLP